MTEAIDVELYRSASGLVELAVKTDGETVWLSRVQLAVLFGRDVKTIGKHVLNAQREELEGVATVAKFATVQRESERTVEHQVEHYNIDMVLSVGYRVKSAEGVHFRRWATQVLRRYLLEGAALDARCLRQLGPSCKCSRALLTNLLQALPKSSNATCRAFARCGRTTRARSSSATASRPPGLWPTTRLAPSSTGLAPSFRPTCCSAQSAAARYAA